jgi:nudix-type nucleoside diphosphatase (YffH/AdpP family)
MSIADRIRVREVTLLSDSHYVLRKTTFDWRRGAVLLTRQFRYPAYVNGYDGLLIEAAAGLLDNASPEDRIRAEAEEEIGYRLRGVRKVFECFMSPGSVTEKLHFFVAEYDPSMRIGAGGGVAEEGEDIDVLELPLGEALAMIDSGKICDAKTVMLLQQAALKGFAAI